MGFKLVDGKASPLKQWPPQFILLLVPEQHVTARIARPDLLGFVRRAEGEVLAYCRAAAGKIGEIQLGFALLPGARLMLDLQTDTAERRVPIGQQLIPRLRALSVPRVESGPVVFARRLRLSNAEHERQFVPPFFSFAKHETATLDNVLLEAACGSVPVRVASIGGFFDRFRKALPSAPTPSLGQAIFELTGIPVVLVDEPIQIGGRPAPFTVIKQSQDSALVQVKYPNGATGIVDQLTLAHASSHAPQPAQAALDAVFAKASRARVREGGVINGKALGESVALDVTDDGQLGEMHEALSIFDGPAGHCMCHGDVSVEILSAADESLAVLGVHHGIGLRWSVWKDDAALLNGRRWLDWLAGHGVEGPLAAFEQAERARQEHRSAQQRWQAAMPAGIKTMPADAWKRAAASNDMTPALDALWDAYPDRRAAILALCEWFGTREGGWTGYPAYESLTERMLFEVPVGELVAALENSDLSERQLEGAARFFAGHAFESSDPTKMISVKDLLTFSGKQIFTPARRGGPVKIPTTLRQRLLAHCLATDDDAKKERARSAFADG